MNKLGRTITGLALILAAFWTACWAASEPGLAPKREFRGAWVATMANIDWPGRPGLSPKEQKAELEKMLDSLARCGINAVIVQVRPKADAFYASATEPWSEFLSGTQGTDPGYDPLKFILEAAHSRGMELHAWLNPFRVTTGSDRSKLSPRNVARRHPDWLVYYGGQYYLDPGLEQVRSYLVGVVAELVRKYDVDAVHLDDYFYPYPQPGKQFPDGKSYQKYGAPLFDDVAQWRRDNVNRLVKSLSDTIRSIKKGLKFGISPFGIYRNASVDPTGSATKGLSNYDDLYADVVMWAKKGWIDYVLPQLYWENGHPAADYGELLSWWSRHSGAAHLYIGHGVYNISPTSRKVVWRTAGEICRQMDMQRAENVSSGSAFYSAKFLSRNTRGVSDSLRTRYFRYKALTPSMPHLDSQPPLPPSSAKALAEGETVKVSWSPGQRDGMDGVDHPSQARYYTIYRFSAREEVNVNDAEHIAALVWADGPLQWTDKQPGKGEWVYVITAVSAAGIESEDFAVSPLARVVR